jgi:hypothetical protein
MKFDEAFKAAQQGKAIAKPHWKVIRFYFYQHGRIWKLSKNGHIRALAIIYTPDDADDWFVVEDAQIPVVPAPRTRQASHRIDRASLKERQAAMKSRWQKGVSE